MPISNDLPENEGKVVEINGTKVALFNDKENLKACSAICTHLGCEVEWNRSEKTWDCPCHGSRFQADGKLLNGPAKRGLDPVDDEIMRELMRKKEKPHS